VICACVVRFSVEHDAACFSRIEKCHIAVVNQIHVFIPNAREKTGRDDAFDVFAVYGKFASRIYDDARICARCDRCDRKRGSIWRALPEQHTAYRRDGNRIGQGERERSAFKNRACRFSAVDDIGDLFQSQRAVEYQISELLCVIDVER